MQAKEGSTVQVHYEGRLPDGTVFDSSSGREPIEFTVGGGQVVPGFDEAVRGMAPGQKKTATIPAEKAYGDRSKELLFEVNRTEVPSDMELKVGDSVSVGLPNGQAIPVQVAAVTEEKVTLDANHPLAGKDLVFELELVKVDE